MCSLSNFCHNRSCLDLGILITKRALIELRIVINVMRATIFHIFEKLLKIRCNVHFLSLFKDFNEILFQLRRHPFPTANNFRNFYISLMFTYDREPPFHSFQSRKTFVRKICSTKRMNSCQHIESENCKIVILILFRECNTSISCITIRAGKEFCIGVRSVLSFKSPAVNVDKVITLAIHLEIIIANITNNNAGGVQFSKM